MGLQSPEGLTGAGGPTSKKAHVAIGRRPVCPHVDRPPGCSSVFAWQLLPPEQASQEND